MAQKSTKYSATIGSETEKPPEWAAFRAYLLLAAAQLAVFGVEHERAARGEVAAQNLLGDQRLRRALEVALERTCAVDRIEAALDDEALGRIRHYDHESLDGKALLEESLAVMDGIRDANIKETAEKFGADAAHGKASDDFDAIGMALAERRVGALFLVKGKILPGGFDINTGTVTFDGDPNPVDDGYIDPAAPDITDAFAQAALAQDAHIYIVEQNQMPTDKSVAALFRYAE